MGAVPTLSPPHAMLSPRPARHRWLWPVALLCTLAYLGTAAHFVLVQHATCAAHGELLHAGEAPAPAPASQHLAGEHLADARSADARFAASDEAPEAGHGAEAHCATALLRRALLRDAQELPRVALRSAAVAAAPARLAPAEPVARLHLAPKASPPAA